MYPPTWQIGLDIQCHNIWAIGLQQRRRGWQLRHWWQHPVPEGTFQGESLQHSDNLVPILQQWKALLPRRFSLRVALPASLVLQQRLVLPEQKLSDREIAWYVSAQAGKLFPVASDRLSIDWRVSAREPRCLYVTAAHLEEVNRWKEGLRQADLKPDAIDIVPCALRVLAQAAGVSESALLLHFTEQYVVWVSPLRSVFNYGFFLIGERNTQQCIEYASSQWQLHDEVDTPDVICCSSTQLTDFPEDTLILSPWAAFQQYQPPLPLVPSAFSVAAGLALRPDDQ